MKEEPKCGPGEHWSSCAIRCTKTCEYFGDFLKKMGTCNKTTDCVPGCVPEDRTECRDGYWRSRSMCVEISHCICISNTGLPVSPGKVVKESECRSCQCIDNFYTCDDSDCEEEFETALAPSIVLE